MIKKRFQLAILTLIALCLPMTLLAQGVQVQDTAQTETRIMTLQETIEFAKENSILARTARYSLIASQWQYQSFRAELLPGLSISGNAPNYNRNFRDLLNPDGSTSQIYTQQSNAQVNLSVSQPIVYTGGNLSVSTGLQRLGIFYGENTYEWTSTPMQIQFSQPLFGFNNLKWASKLQPLQLQIAEKNYDEAVENLSYQVTNAYFNVLEAKNNLEISEFNVAVNDSIYILANGRFEVGSIAENDLLQSELQLRNSETSLNQDRLTYEQELKSFRLLLGLNADTPIDVEAPTNIPQFDVDIETALEMARTNNSQWLSFQLQQTQAERNLDQQIKEGTFTPVISASYGLNQTSSDFGQLYQDPLSRQGLNISFQLPIFNWGQQRAEIQSARNTQRQVADDIAYEQALFVLQIENTINNFQQLNYQLENAELSYDIAQRRYDVAYQRYRITRITLTDLQNAQRDRDQAQQAYIQAIGNYWLGVYNLRRLTLYDFETDTIINHEL